MSLNTAIGTTYNINEVVLVYLGYRITELEDGDAIDFQPDGGHWADKKGTHGSFVRYRIHDGDHGTLVVDSLAPLGQDQQYQLWLIQDGERTDGGVFSVNPEGYGSLWVETPQPLSSYSAFGITIEPAGGSPGPTGDKVLGSAL